MGPSCKMPLRVCVVVVGRSMRLVPVCEYVNVSECVSQCLVFQHNGLLFVSPPTRLLVNLCPSQQHPSNSATHFLFFSTWFHLFLLESLLFYTHFFLCQFMGFIEVFKCSPLYSSHSFVTLLSLFNGNKKSHVVHTLSLFLGS